MAASILLVNQCVMDRMQKFKASFLVSCAVLALSGCNTNSRNLGPCPITGILKEAETMTVFAPGRAQDKSAIQHRVAIGNIGVECVYRNKDEKNARVLAQISFDITAQAGPALSADAVDVPYFVAITRDDRSILARTEYVLRLEGLSSNGRATGRENIRSIVIPLADKLTGASYEVVVGLALTPEQAAFNRRQLQH